MFTAVCYQLLFKSSQLLSPKMCRAYRRLKPGDQLDWNSRCVLFARGCVRAGAYVLMRAWHVCTAFGTVLCASHAAKEEPCCSNLSQRGASFVCMCGHPRSRFLSSFLHNLPHTTEHRLPSTLHAVVVSALCIWALCYSGAFFDTTAAATTLTGSVTSSSTSYGDSSSTSSIQQLPVVLRVSPVSYAIIGISFGYFIMDAALLSLHPELATREMCVHHAVALMSLVVAAQVAAMHVYLMLVLLTELTTPIGGW